MTTLDPTLLPALDRVQRSLEAPRRIDTRQLLNTLQRLDWEMRTRHYPAVIEADDPRDAEAFFEAEQSPSDASFR